MMIIMQHVRNATEVRSKFSEFIDNVVRERPQILKRNRDLIASFSIQHILALLSLYEISMEFEEGEDGRFYGSIEQIEDIVGEGGNLQELREDLAGQLVEYAQDYYNNFSRYFNAPNRSAHFPYVFRVLIQEDLEGVVGLIRG